MSPLSDVDHNLLALASGLLCGAALVHAIRDSGLTEVSYHQRLNRLVETEAALAADPVLVNRLRRLRGRRR